MQLKGEEAVICSSPGGECPVEAVTIEGKILEEAQPEDLGGTLANEVVPYGVNAADNSVAEADDAGPLALPHDAHLDLVVLHLANVLLDSAVIIGCCQ